MAKPKSRIRIQDLSREVKVSADEMRRVTGGVGLRGGGAGGYRVSGPFLKWGVSSIIVQNPLIGGAVFSK